MKTYWVSFAVTLTMALTLIFWADPSGRWHRRQHLSRPLLRGEVMVLENVNRDELGFRMEQLGDHDGVSLVALGSSRVLLMDSLMVRGDFFNAGVSGAGLDNFAVIWDKIRAFKKPPQAVLVFIDPWVFGPLPPGSRAADMISRTNGGALSSLRVLFGRWQSVLSQLKELFTWSMVSESLRLVIPGQPTILGTPSIKLETDLLGSENAVRWDGSIRFVGTPARPTPWSAPNKPGRDAAHLFLKEWKWQDSSFQLMRDLLGDIRRHGAEVVLVLPPFSPEGYHWMKQEPILSSLMRQVKDSLGQISAEDRGISYCDRLDPALSGCGDGDFYDELHMKRPCMEKVVRGCFADLKKTF